MSFQRQFAFWAGACVILVLFLWIFSGVLLPFVAGMALAYLLDPIADRITRRGIPRTIAALLILGLFVLLFALALIVIVPVMADQLAAFAERMPEYVRRLQQLIAGESGTWLSGFIGDRLPQVQENVGQIVSQGAVWFGNFLTSLWAGGQALLSIVSLLVVTPVVAFYLLVDWDRMVTSIDSWTPIRHRETVRRLAREIDGAVSGFVRGQALVCVILGIFYAVGLSLVGLNFALLIGLGAGLITFIPYIGSMTGLLLSGGVAIVQFWPDPVMIGAVLAIFFVGQFLEGNILSPNLVGRSVGLHPVWLMFALFAFGTLFGFVGLLLAVPLAAAVGVLVRFALGRYLDSPYYTGAGGESRLKL